MLEEASSDEYTDDVSIIRKRRAADDIEAVDLKRSAPFCDAPATGGMGEITLLERCREPSPIVITDWLQTFKSMPRSVQVEALSDLVDLCSTAHVKHLQSIIAPHFQKDFVRILPKEISLKIAAYLSPEDLVRITQLSSNWRSVAEDNLIWARKCRERNITELPPPNNCQHLNWQILAEKHRQQHVTVDTMSDLVPPPFALLELPSLDEEAGHSFFCRPHFRRPLGSRAKVLSMMDPDATLPTGPSTSTWMPALLKTSNTIEHAYRQHADVSTELKSCWSRCKWKATFLRSLRVCNNWRRRRASATCELRGHDEHVITCMQIVVDATGAQRIITGSDDNRLRVWSVARAECERVLSGHAGGVWTLQLSADRKLAISGSTDRTVRVWSIDEGTCVHTLNGHTSTVRCMALKDDILVSGSRDCTVRIWNIREGRAIRTLYGHLAAVRCVQFDGRRIISGGYDYNLIVWDAQTGTQIHVLCGHNNRVYSLLYNSERGLAISGSLDTTIRVWNVETGECLHTLVGHQSLTSGFDLCSNLLLSANADSTIKVWNLNDGQCVHTLAGSHRHISAVTSLQVFNDELVISSGDDGTVKLWDFKRGQCLLLKGFRQLRSV